MLDFDVTVANAARMYDYLLGGKDNFAADREAAEQLISIAPDARVAAADNRRFLGNAVRYLAGEAGITQFLDIGSGLPSMGNVHEVAREVNRAARVAYVDYDPVAVNHAHSRLSDPLVIAALGDLGEPESITGHTAVQGLIDFAQPVAVTLAAVLHFLSDRDAEAALAHLKDFLVPGSYLAISHSTADGAREGEADKITDLYDQASAALHLRTLEQISDFFWDLELVPPGVVEAGRWRSETPAKRVVSYAGVGRVR
jgi:hypothetical protein